LRPDTHQSSVARRLYLLFYITDGEAQVHCRVLADHQRDAGLDALGEAVLYRADVVLSNGKRGQLIAAGAVGLVERTRPVP
jgi:hypothetical protein